MISHRPKSQESAVDVCSNARRLRGDGRTRSVDVIDAGTKFRQFKQELVWNDGPYGLKSRWTF
jgi:hypothetical protein